MLKILTLYVVLIITHTAFELMMDNPNYDGAITTLCGGGRYNGLLELLDGPNQTGIGFALSIERLLLALEEEELNWTSRIRLIFIVMGEEAERYSVKLLNQLRKSGIKADKDYLQRKVKGQMKQADRLNAQYTVVIGDQELENEVIDVKDMSTGETETINLNNLVNYFQEK